MFAKEKLVFDGVGTLDDADNVGAWIRSADGTMITHTAVSGKDGLDVHLINESIEVTADGLDIRALTQTDEVTVFQGTSPWVVSATDLDIRDLDHTTDNVAISQNGNTLVVNADGSINVNAEVEIDAAYEYEEDSQHESGDIGAYVLAVRQDTLAPSTSADGDYASFKVNADGALWVQLADNTVNALPPSHTGWLVGNNTINNTAELVVSSDLTNRRKILIQNVSSGGRTIHLGHSDQVSSSNGIRLSAGAAVELELAAGVGVWAIGPSAGPGADIRIAEFAAA